MATNKIPYIVTHDGRTIRFAHPDIKANDTIKLNLDSGEIEDWIKFEMGNIAMCVGGTNIGRVGIIIHKEKHMGGFDLYHIKDNRDHSFATRITNLFVIGKGKKPWITLPRQQGIKLTTLEEQEEKLK